MTIEDWRAEIDAVDEELLRLLNVRATLAIRVGESKRSAGLSVLDSAREREVVERARRANAGPLALPHHQPDPRPPDGHTFYETPNRKTR